MDAVALPDTGTMGFDFYEESPQPVKMGPIASALEELRKFEELNVEHGCLLTGAQAAGILGVGRAFIRDLAARGKIKRFDLPLGVFYSGNDVKARLQGDRDRGGRP